MVSGVFTTLIWLPVFVALWIGVVGLAKAGRGGAWWTMLSGLVLLTLGLVGSVVGALIAFRAMADASSGTVASPSELMSVVVVGVGLVAGGILIFAIGFALHGFKARRLPERITELEMIVEAQNEQLARAEGGSRS